jgi:integrase
MLITAIKRYLRIRRAAGFQLRTAEGMLRDFARAAAQAGDSHVRAQTAITWAAKSPSVQQRQSRLSAIAMFAKYVRAEDPRHEVPSPDVFAAPHRRPLPHIYTPDEIIRLLAEAARLGPVGSLRPLTYQTLFGLLATCGLRPSEALALQLCDVTPDGLVIRETKFRKNRLVPLHESTRQALNAYLARRRAVATDSRHVFISMKGQRLAYPTLIATFVIVARKAGVRALARGKPRGGRASGQLLPRLHDLRHTFAVRALESCPRDAVASHMHALSTYLGHARPADTYWYLHATPHLMSSIADACRESMEVAP